MPLVPIVTMVLATVLHADNLKKERSQRGLGPRDVAWRFSARCGVWVWCSLGSSAEILFAALPHGPAHQSSHGYTFRRAAGEVQCGFLVGDYDNKSTRAFSVGFLCHIYTLRVVAPHIISCLPPPRLSKAAQWKHHHRAGLLPAGLNPSRAYPSTSKDQMGSSRPPNRSAKFSSNWRQRQKSMAFQSRNMSKDLENRPWHSSRRRCGRNKKLSSSSNSRYSPDHQSRKHSPSQTG